MELQEAACKQVKSDRRADCPKIKGESTDANDNEALPAYQEAESRYKAKKSFWTRKRLAIGTLALFVIAVAAGVGGGIG